MTILEDFQRERVFFMKADNDRMHGKMQVHKRLRLEETIDKSFKPKTSDVEAAKAAVRGTTQKAAKSDAVDPMELMNMSGVAFEKFLERERQKAG